MRPVSFIRGWGGGTCSQDVAGQMLTPWVLRFYISGLSETVHSPVYGGLPAHSHSPIKDFVIHLQKSLGNAEDIYA